MHQEDDTNICWMFTCSEWLSLNSEIVADPVHVTWKHSGDNNLKNKFILIVNLIITTGHGRRNTQNYSCTYSNTVNLKNLKLGHIHIKAQ